MPIVQNDLTAVINVKKTNKLLNALKNLFSVFFVMSNNKSSDCIMP